MKRVPILTLIPNLGTGGAQRVFANLNHLLSEKYEIIPVAFTAETGNNNYGIDKVTFLHVGSGKTVLGKARNFILRVARLRNLKKKLKISLCMSHMEGANYVNVLSGYSKSILIVHGSKKYDRDPQTRFKFVNGFFIRILYNRSHRVVTVSKGIKDELIRYYGVRSEKISPIFNFFDFDEIISKSIRRTDDAIFKQLSSGKKIIVQAGRFHPQKNHEALVRIFKKIHTKRNDTLLVLLGDGTLRAQIEKLCEMNGLKICTQPFEEGLENAHVYFAGNVNNPYAYFSKADVFLFPSRWEGFPMALCEAMICGLKVIASDCPTGPNEIVSKVDPRFGVLLPIPESESECQQWAYDTLALLDSGEFDSRNEIEKLRKFIGKEEIRKLWQMEVDEAVQ